jgi:hypothetical protein
MVFKITYVYTHLNTCICICIGLEELPRDFTKMFDYNIFQFDVDLIPQAKRYTCIYDNDYDVYLDERTKYTYP